jgi:hypothetical protein
MTKLTVCDEKTVNQLIIACMSRSTPQMAI